MSAGLQPYPAYKPSGVEWLGEVPAHWEVRRLAHMGRLTKGRGGTREDSADCGVPCIRYGDLYTQYRFFIERAMSFVSHDTVESYTPIQYGDVLFAGSGETIEDIGKSAVSLLPSPACCGGDVIIFRPSSPVNARFLGLATDCSYAANQKSCMGRGITVMHIYGDELKYLSISLPILPEQTAIARFLDHANDRVDRCIRAKKKLIALLDEYKQALIHQAVTGQIDVQTGRPYKEYKESGVEWLGKVPEHWGVAALRHRYDQCLGKMLDSKRIVGAHLTPYLRNVDVQWDRINVSDLPLMDIGPDEVERFTVRTGDLLVCEGGEVGRCAIWAGQLELCAFQKALHRLRPCVEGRDNPRFMRHCLRAAADRGAFEDGHESTIGHLTGEKLRAHRFPFPPTHEQGRIVQFVDDKVREIHAASNNEGNLADSLQEYRTRLIADVVTGKLDVREAAADLPDSDAPKASSRSDDSPTGGEGREPDEALSAASSVA